MDADLSIADPWGEHPDHPVADWQAEVAGEAVVEQQQVAVARELRGVRAERPREVGMIGESPAH